MIFHFSPRSELYHNILKVYIWNASTTKFTSYTLVEMKKWFDVCCAFAFCSEKNSSNLRVLPNTWRIFRNVVYDSCFVYKIRAISNIAVNVTPATVSSHTHTHIENCATYSTGVVDYRSLSCNAHLVSAFCSYMFAFVIDTNISLFLL